MKKSNLFDKIPTPKKAIAYVAYAVNRDTQESYYVTIFGALTKNCERCRVSTRESAKKGVAQFEQNNTDNVTGLYDFGIREIEIEPTAYENREFLEPRFDGAQSFYRKAEIVQTRTGFLLESFRVPVVLISEKTVFLGPDWNYSRTTIRHVKEFLKQQGYKAESKEQILKDYGENE